MRHDHHQEEIERRWQRMRRYEDYSGNTAQTDREKPKKRAKPSFWLWMRLSIDHCCMCFATVVACAAAGYFLLASDGVIQNTPWTEHELMTYSILFGMAAIAMLGWVAIEWRKFKYYQPNDGESD